MKGGNERPDDLATVINAWDRLPEAVKAGIVAMVKASLPNPIDVSSSPSATKR
jgi:hypothetical protein